MFPTMNGDVPNNTSAPTGFAHEGGHDHSDWTATYMGQSQDNSWILQPNVDINWNTSPVGHINGPGSTQMSFNNGLPPVAGSVAAQEDAFDPVGQFTTLFDSQSEDTTEWLN